MGNATLKKVLEKFPEKVPQGSGSDAGMYRVAQNMYAAAGPLTEAMKGDRVATLEHEQIHVLRLPAENMELDFPKGGNVTAVYTLNRNGTFFIPTGRLFVRLEKNKKLQDLARRLAALQFRIVDIPAYAPHAGWIAHESGEPGRALAELDSVRNLEGVENVEPQMLSARSLKK